MESNDANVSQYGERLETARVRIKFAHLAACEAGQRKHDALDQSVATIIMDGAALSWRGHRCAIATHPQHFFASSDMRRH